jgi:signal transduction histidine kinase
MNTIRGNLTRKLLLGWAVLLVAGCGVAYVMSRAALIHQFDQALRVKALALSSLIEQDQGRIDLDFGDLKGEFDNEISGASFEVWDKQGQVIARSDSLHSEYLPWSQRFVASPRFWNLTVAGLPSRAVSLVIQPHLKNEEKQAAVPMKVILAVATDRRELDKSLAALAGVLTVSGLLMLSLTAGVLPRLLRRELAPLDRLGSQAQSISAETLSQRFPTDGIPGELLPITARLNELLQRLQTSFERERQYGNDLAHEFRTPLAELRSLAELSLKWPDTRNADSDRNMLAIALQMEGIIKRLLALARSDLGQMAVEPTTLDLANLVHAVCQPLEERAAGRNISLQVKVSPGLQIETDEVLARSILTNLLDNAVDYSSPGATVQVHGEVRNGDFTLRVINPVTDLRPEDLPNLFERFWRKDAARTEGAHSGLGLPLARAFATSLGYTLNATLNDEKFLTIALAGPGRNKISTLKQTNQTQENKMTNTKFKSAGLAAVLAVSCGLSMNAQAGKAQKWDELPKAVQLTILANGGKAGQTVDLENGKPGAKGIYEAPVKDQDGTVADLVVSGEGKVIETKHDDAADAAKEKADRVAKAGSAMKFSHPRDITNPYVPLSMLKQDVLEGSEGAKKVRIERTAKPNLHKTFKIGTQEIEAFVVEDREWEDGQLAEVAVDYFAQDDAGTVFYLGEDVDEYQGGKLSSHEGSWLLGKDTQNPGVIFPGILKLGAKFKSEDVNKDINEDDEVVSMSEDVVTPAGSYKNCVKVKESLADGTTEYKYYAKGVGVVREVPSVGDVRLISHKTSRK